jgi:ribonucleoside-diphosphate reductase alpha chain
LWDEIGYAAWRCADPGVQYDTTINAWHTCPASGRINASNPCSEYMFLDNTACNLASINLLKFYDPRRGRSMSRLRARDRSVDDRAGDQRADGAFPSRRSPAQLPYRTLGLGYANLGAMLMQAGIPYDSERPRAVCGALTAILTGRGVCDERGDGRRARPLRGLSQSHKEHMLRVIRNHRALRMASREDDGKYEGLPSARAHRHALAQRRRSTFPTRGDC